jgi:hypothetical protein
MLADWLVVTALVECELAQELAFDREALTSRSAARTGSFRPGSSMSR